MAFMNAMALGATIRVGVGNSVGQLRKLHGAFGRVSGMSTKLAGGLGTVGMAMTAVGAAGLGVAGILGVMGGKAASFESQMSAVGAVMLKSRSEISEMESTAKKLGASTVFSATQVGEGMELMARAGFEVIDIIGPNGEGGGIEGVLNAAAASGDSLAATANTVSNVLKGMGLETSEASRVADVLALASSKTNSTIGSLGESIKNVASTAKQFNIPLEQTVAGIALLQDVGLDASVAGSSMNTMLTKMATMSDGTKNKLKKLGVTFETVEGNMLPFPEVLDGIAKAAAESGGNMDAAGLLAELFGLRGQKAAANLKEMASSGRFAELTEQLMNAEGSAKRMAELRLDNLTGQMTLLSSATEGFAIQAMSPLNEELKEAVKNMAEFTQAVTLGMGGEGEGAASDFGRGLMEGITLMVDGLKWSRLQMEAMTDSIGQGDTAWAKMAGAITAVLVVATALLAPVVLALGMLFMFASFFGSTLIPFIAAGAAIVSVIALGLGAMFVGARTNGVTFLDLLGAIHKAAKEVWLGMRMRFMANWEMIRSAFEPGLKALRDAWVEIMVVFGAGQVETSAGFLTMGDALGKVVTGMVLAVGLIFTITAMMIKMGSVAVNMMATPLVSATSMIIGGFVDLITGADTLQSALGRIFFGIGLIMTRSVRGSLNTILDMVKAMINNPAAQLLARMLGVDTTAAINSLQDTIAEPPMPEWMEPQDKAATMSARLMDLMSRSSADVATPPDPEVTVVNEDKRCIEIDNKLSVEGRDLAIATAEHRQDIKDRTGAVVSPWQRRQVLEHGATLLPS